MTQGTLQNVGGNAVKFRVQLQGGNEVLGAGDLEVHVTESVFRAQDVSQGRKLGAVFARFAHQTHRDAGNRGAQRHASVQQGQRRGAN